MGIEPTQKRRGAPEKRREDKVRRMNFSLPPDIAEAIRTRGGRGGQSEYIARLVREDLARNP